MKIIFSAVIFLSILAASAFAGTERVSLNTTGYEWLGFDQAHKRAFAGMLHIALNVNKGRYNTDDVIKALDEFYKGAIEEAKADPLHVDEDIFLKIRCVDVISNHLDYKAEIVKARQIEIAGRAGREQADKEPS